MRLLQFYLVIACKDSFGTGNPSRGELYGMNFTKRDDHSEAYTVYYKLIWLQM
jgi:hypothetical protein